MRKFPDERRLSPMQSTLAMKKTSAAASSVGQSTGPTDGISNIWMVCREYEGLAGAGGVKDVCRQSAEAFARNGFRVTMGVMQRAIRIYRQEPERVRSMQKEAVRIINDHYTWDIVIQRYLELYRQAKSMAAQKNG